MITNEVKKISVLKNLNYKHHLCNRTSVNVAISDCKTLTTLGDVLYYLLFKTMLI